MFPTRWRNLSNDSLLSDDNGEKDGQWSPPLQLERRSKRKFNFWVVLPWILCSILSTLLLITRIPYRYDHIFNSYENGFATEFDFTNETMAIRNVRFTGDIQIDSNGTVYLSQDANGPHYVGPPSPEIDQAWDDLLLNGDRYIGLTPEEVAQKTDFQVEKEDLVLDLYWVEPNSLHSIHCLNMLRKYTYHEYYTEIEDLPPAPFRVTDRLHLDHCIDAIRQTLLCSFDTTPVPRPWRPEAGFYLSKIEQWHTCRNPDPVNSWLHWKNEDFDESMFVNASHRFRDPNALYTKYSPR